MTFDLPIGRMISGNKSGPKGHVCVFNGNLCTKSEGKFWYGDLDLTKESAELSGLAMEKGEDVYVLRERDARFHTQDSPRYENAVAVYRPDGTFTILEGALNVRNS